MFQLGDLSPLQENMIYSIFGELRDVYDENEAAIFSYSSLAMLAGNTFYSSREQKLFLGLVNALKLQLRN